MIYSMTGFGRAEKQTGERKITVEIKSVNHRYLELSVRAPRKLNRFEAGIRALIKEYAERGKLDLYIGLEEFASSDMGLVCNEALAAQYVKAAAEMSSRFSIPNDFGTARLLSSPEVLTLSEVPVDEEQLWKDLEAAIREAAENFRSVRNAEGLRLREDLLGKLDNLAANVGKVEERAPQILEEYKLRLKEKTKELLENAQLDESRIAAEVILFADKICTDEETVRLRSHIQAMRSALQDGGGIGRKLDFLAQEMNREANTILSKSNDTVTSEIAVELKTEIEKIREQIQNIE